MAKKVIQLTEGELARIIKDVTIQALNEMDGATYARIYNATHRAKNDIQSRILQRAKTTTNKYRKDGKLRKTPIVHTDMINNDDFIAREREMEERAQRHWLKDFIGQSFKFFSEDRLGIPADVILKFDQITKLSPEKTILVGTVTYNTTQIEGDGIMIDFVRNKVQYHERGSRYAFNLEVDKRSEPLWNQLISQIKMALDSRVK